MWFPNQEAIEQLKKQAMLKAQRASGAESLTVGPVLDGGRSTLDAPPISFDDFTGLSETGPMGEYTGVGGLDPKFDDEGNRAANTVFDEPKGWNLPENAPLELQSNITADGPSVQELAGDIREHSLLGLADESTGFGAKEWKQWSSENPELVDTLLHKEDIAAPQSPGEVAESGTALAASTGQALEGAKPAATDDTQAMDGTLKYTDTGKLALPNPFHGTSDITEGETRFRQSLNEQLARGDYSGLAGAGFNQAQIENIKNLNKAQQPVGGRGGNFFDRRGSGSRGSLWDVGGKSTVNNWTAAIPRGRGPNAFGHGRIKPLTEELLGKISRGKAIQWRRNAINQARAQQGLPPATFGAIAPGSFNNPALTTGPYGRTIHNIPRTPRRRKYMYPWLASQG